MPRLARLPPIPFGWYYVTLRSVTNRRIFTSHAELKALLKQLRTTLREKGARLHAGYIAEHEAHLALQAGDGSVSAITGSLQHEYARTFNRARDEHGSLFRLHYRAILFQHQKLLVPLAHYIHWIRRLDAPENHQNGLWWSTDAIYRGSKKQDWVTTNVVLRMLTRGAYSREIQEEAYRNLFDGPPRSSQARSFRRGSAKDPRILGDPQFVEEMWQKSGRRSPDQTQRTRDYQGDIQDVVMQVIEQFNSLCDQRLPPEQAVAWKRIVTSENLRSRSRKRPLPLVRALSASYLIKHRIATPTQAARFFNCGPKAVSAQRRRFYDARFRESFGAKPEILFSPASTAESSGEMCRRL
ncbi:MAG TPA: hypothetical protein VK580_00980 [Steroidobacteraceae bacterium]|nr:hypothetical protein [Steroidobacteraceae bacterium]